MVQDRAVNDRFAYPSARALCGLLLILLALGAPLRAAELNVYSARKEALIKPLLDKYSAASGVTVNLVTGKGDALLTRLKARVEQVTGSRFNSVLLNYYRDQRDSMGLHADDEPELGAEPVIASLSLGEERKLVFRHRSRRELTTVSVPLPSGSLLVMRGPTQRHWKHGIRKLTRPCGPRVNLTFRRVYPDLAAG